MPLFKVHSFPSTLRNAGLSIDKPQFLPAERWTPMVNGASTASTFASGPAGADGCNRPQPRFRVAISSSQCNVCSGSSFRNRLKPDAISSQSVSDISVSACSAPAGWGRARRGAVDARQVFAERNRENHMEISLAMVVFSLTTCSRASWPHPAKSHTRPTRGHCSF